MTDTDPFDALQEEIIADIREAYSPTAVEHWMNPNNQRAIAAPDGHAEITGPCGDTVTFFIRVADERIAEASYLTDGCGPTIIAGSMGVTLATGKSIAEAKAINQPAILDALGGLPEDGEHCALLVANTLRAAIDDYLG